MFYCFPWKINNVYITFVKKILTKTLDAHQPKTKAVEVLLSVTKNTDFSVKHTKTNPQETLDFGTNRPIDFFF